MKSSVLSKSSQNFDFLECFLGTKVLTILMCGFSKVRSKQIKWVWLFSFMKLSRQYAKAMFVPKIRFRDFFPLQTNMVPKIYGHLFTLGSVNEKHLHPFLMGIILNWLMNNFFYQNQSLIPRCILALPTQSQKIVINKRFLKKC